MPKKGENGAEDIREKRGICGESAIFVGPFFR